MSRANLTSSDVLWPVVGRARGLPCVWPWMLAPNGSDCPPELLVRRLTPFLQFEFSGVDFVLPVGQTRLNLLMLGKPTFLLLLKLPTLLFQPLLPPLGFGLPLPFLSLEGLPLGLYLVPSRGKPLGCLGVRRCRSCARES